jgi:hypothetical protein
MLPETLGLNSMAETKAMDSSADEENVDQVEIPPEDAKDKPADIEDSEDPDSESEKD